MLMTWSDFIYLVNHVSGLKQSTHTHSVVFSPWDQSKIDSLWKMLSLYSYIESGLWPWWTFLSGIIVSDELTTISDQVINISCLTGNRIILFCLLDCNVIEQVLDLEIWYSTFEIKLKKLLKNRQQWNWIISEILK